MPAVFFKGFFLKYGLKLYYKPDLDRAKALLELASKNGVGAAIVELEHFHKHYVLTRVKSVHTEFDRDKWE